MTISRFNNEQVVLTMTFDNGETYTDIKTKVVY